MKKNYVFTGGGSGGHTIPALTIFRSLDKNHINVTYYGSYSGIESEIIPKEKIKYRKIFTGKLRRYLTWRHFPDFIKFFLGIAQATFYLMMDRPHVVFSTGGFVSLPVVIAAWVLQIKVVIHEQTSRVGLANRIAARFADKVLISFEASRSYFPSHKVEWTGYPLRPSLFTPVNTHFEIQGTDFSLLKLPVLLFMGGGNGAKLINDFVDKNFFDLIKHHHVVLQCGSIFWSDWKGRVHPHFTAFTFLGNELVELMKMSQVIVARAGAGTVCEVMALQKPAIFIPLKIAQKNEQYHNAMESKNLIGSGVILEDEFLKLTLADFFKQVEQVQISPKNISTARTNDAISKIINLL